MFLINVDGMRGWITGQPVVVGKWLYERVTIFDPVLEKWAKDILVHEDRVALGWGLAENLEGTS